MLIETSKLKAALFCSATKDIRYYLNGVLLRKRRNKFNLFSTNGSVAFFGNLGVLDSEYADDFDIIIPEEAIKQACKGKEKYIALMGVGSESCSLGNVLFTPIEGKFPDMARVIPTEILNIIAQFQPAALKQIFDSLNTWNNKKNGVYKIQHNGDGAALIVGSDDVFCIAMPYRADHCASGIPFSILI